MSRFDDLLSLLSAEGPLSVLAALNCTVPHRYTAIYQVRGDLIRNLFLIDKLGEVVPQMLLEVPMNGSFCQFVIRDGAFHTSDSAADPRLDGLPGQGYLVSYTAVPIAGANKEVRGTLCHFDLVHQDLPAEDYDLMHCLAKHLLPYVATEDGK